MVGTGAILSDESGHCRPVVRNARRTGPCEDVLADGDSALVQVLENPPRLASKTRTGTPEAAL